MEVLPARVLEQESESDNGLVVSSLSEFSESKLTTNVVGTSLDDTPDVAEPLVAVESWLNLGWRRPGLSGGSSVVMMCGEEMEFRDTWVDLFLVVRGGCSGRQAGAFDSGSSMVRGGYTGSGGGLVLALT